MNKILIVILFIFSTLLAYPAVAQEFSERQPDEFYKARVLEIISEEVDDDPYLPLPERFRQIVSVVLLTGPDEGTELELSYVPGGQEESINKLKAGDTLIAVRTQNGDEFIYYLADHYRLTSVMWVLGFFVLLVVLLAGWKGVRSLLGLGVTLITIIYIMIPAIINGSNPVLISLGAGSLIAVLSLYIAHGLGKRTTLAVISTLITLGIATLLAFIAVEWTKLFGLGSEEAFYLQISQLQHVNIKGLLLGGIIIGALGVLDDITTAQAAVVEQLYKANPNLSRTELFKRALAVGHEHIASLVNTLALAYVGVSFPLMLLFTQSQQPTEILLNSELIIEELIRTLVGSAALIIAVPITTYLAAQAYGRHVIEPSDGDHHGHVH